MQKQKEKAKEKPKSLVASIYNAIVDFFAYIWAPFAKFGNWIKRKVIMHWRKLLIISIVLACLLLAALTVIYSFKGVSYITTGIVVNWSQSRYYSGQYTNQIIYTGLGSTFLTVPSTRFLVEFSNQSTEGSQSDSGISNKLYSKYIAKQQTVRNPIIKARVVQGTILQVSAAVRVQISIIANLKPFFENYGQNWQAYLSGKIKNVIIQQIAKVKFYQLTNKLIKSNINSVFTTVSAVSGFPFRLSLVNIRLNYPRNSFSIKNSLGAQLLKAKSLLMQLQAQYKYLQTDIISLTPEISALHTSKGLKQGTIKGRQLVNSLIGSEWQNGLLNLQSAFQNSTYVDKYLWNYFQCVYNSTYKAV